MENSPHMYTDFAQWWHLISPPEEYLKEAQFYRQLFLERQPVSSKKMLELGSGGGNIASIIKSDFDLTLVELSAEMILESQRLNPDLPHIQGDMRHIRLGQEFDFVFVHDAIMYMRTEVDLSMAFSTAAIHCKIGGSVLFAPNEVVETFEPFTHSGGEDDPMGGGVRFLQWAYDPNPDDSTYVMDFALMRLNAVGEITLAHDRHILGLFSRQSWLRLLGTAGFEALSILDPFGRDVFWARRVL